MKINKILLFFTLLLLFSLSGCNPRSGSDSENNTSTTQAPPPPVIVTYNILLEISGSMKGFFTPKVNGPLETIISKYEADLKNNGEINLNYLIQKSSKSEEEIEHYDLSIDEFLKEARNRSTPQSYSNCEKILSKALDVLKEDEVNIVISDFGFTTDLGSMESAQARIKAMFVDKLRKRDLAVAIMKYDCTFDGTFYPGKLPCKHSLPVYIWVIGKSSNVKHVVDLSVAQKESSEMLILQPEQKLKPIYGNLGRMNGANNSIRVNKWPKNSRNNYYDLSFTVNTSSLIMSESEISALSSYTISDGYELKSIEKQSAESYKFTITTQYPHAGEVEIKMPCAENSPAWVEASNHEGGGVPPVGKTLGVKYAINGVYDSYYEVSTSKINIIINFIN